MKTLDDGKAIVIHSGGQDSTTCLAWAIGEWLHKNVKSITFDYGQRHTQEINAAVDIAKMFDIENYLIKADIIDALTESALLSDDVDISQFKDGLPVSFVPGRNLFFIITTAMLAYKLNIRNIVLGFCQTDHSGYPDCREVTIAYMQQAINYGLDTVFKIHTPLMQKTKSETFKMAEELNILDIILDKTVTCYDGDQTKHAWGHGCGRCPACRLREKGWHEFSR